MPAHLSRPRGTFPIITAVLHAMNKITVLILAAGRAEPGFPHRMSSSHIHLIREEIPHMSNTTERPVAGILDVVGPSAFVRVDGYYAGPDDIHVSPGLMRQYGLRRGDEIIGVADADSRRGKHDPLVRVDSINGLEPNVVRRRPSFYDLTPLFPQERLRLETDPHVLTTRVIDLVMPI